MARSTTRYCVRPRYTPGSPAQVPQGVALRVLHEEGEGLERAADGVYGEEEQATAMLLGLHNVVYTLTERRGRWEVLDLGTLERYHRPFRYKVGASIEWLSPRGWRRGKVADDSGGPSLSVYPVSEHGWRPAEPVERRFTRDPDTVQRQRCNSDVCGNLADRVLPTHPDPVFVCDECSEDPRG